MKNKMKQKWRILLCVFGALLVAIACFAGAVWLSFSGNPLHRLAVTNRVKAYLQAQYPDQAYETHFAIYDFKMGMYLCHEELPGSPDSSFTVYEERDGTLRDDYQERVINHFNTKMRIGNALVDEVDKVFAGMPYHCRFVYGEVTAWREERLALDMAADAYHIPGETMLVVCMETQGTEPTWEEMEQRLQQLAAFAQAKDLPFDAYSISLEYPYVNTGTEEMEDLHPICFDSMVDSGVVPASVIQDEALLHTCLLERRAAIEQEQAELASGTYVKPNNDTVDEG